MKCAMGGNSGSSFTRVNHQELGVVLICDTCLLQEKTGYAPCLTAAGVDAWGSVTIQRDRSTATGC